MKALVLAPFAADDLDRLRRRMTVLYEPWTETRKLWDPAELAQRLTAEDIEAVAVEVDFLFGEVFEDPCPLRLIGLCRNAVNHVDMEAAAARGVAVVNTPGRNANAVAELVIGLALAVARRIPEGHAYVRGGAWERPLDPYLSLRGVELAGRTMGVIGMGAVGRRVARLARALGMRVIAHDPYAAGPRSVTMASLEAVLSAADVVTLHVPDTAETRGMLDARRIATMRPGAVLVNTASAALVDEAALAEALRTGRLGGAGIDVYETHPVMPHSPLLTLDNVALTPHIGGATAETVARYSRVVTRALLRYERERRPSRPRRRTSRRGAP